MRRIPKLVFARLLPCLCLSACVVEAEVPAPEPWTPTRDAMVFGLEPYTDGFETTYDDGCLWLSDHHCVALDLFAAGCEDGGSPLDVVFSSGQVAAVLCYPLGDPVFELDATGSDLVIGAADRWASIEFDPDADGWARPGSITIYADDVVLFGHGPGSTIIDGDIVVYGDRVQLRGLTLLGDLLLAGDAAAVTYTDIEGTLVSEGADGVFAGNRILSGASLRGGGDLVVANAVQGSLELVRWSTECYANYFYFDSDSDGALDGAERGAPIMCE